ncbi:hypothetical protein VTO42DRAFT_8052 [Malbranchea cinnamomea]
METKRGDKTEGRVLWAPQRHVCGRLWETDQVVMTILWWTRRRGGEEGDAMCLGCGRHKGIRKKTALLSQGSYIKEA